MSFNLKLSSVSEENVNRIYSQIKTFKLLRILRTCVYVRFVCILIQIYEAGWMTVLHCVNHLSLTTKYKLKRQNHYDTDDDQVNHHCQDTF